MSEDLKMLLEGGSPSVNRPVVMTGLEFDHACSRPVIKKTVGYIVVGLAFDEEGRVLMMQEAKASCRGAWYLPAGRLEPDETMLEGVCREVLEETGLHFRAETMLCLEMQGAAWQRITFVGTAPTGRLKPKPDKESLDAKWMKWPDLKNKPIRCPDIFSLIELGIEYQKSREPKFLPLLPTLTPVDQLFLRLVLFREDSGDDADISILTTDDDRLPVLGMDAFTPRIHRFLTKAAKQLTDDAVDQLTCRGLLATHHDGRFAKTGAASSSHVVAKTTTKEASSTPPFDGSCHTLMMKVEVRPDCPAATKGFQWTTLDLPLKKAMKRRLVAPAVIFL